MDIMKVIRVQPTTNLSIEYCLKRLLKNAKDEYSSLDIHPPTILNEAPGLGETWQLCTDVTGPRGIVVRAKKYTPYLSTSSDHDIGIQASQAKGIENLLDRSISEISEGLD
ncbi:hypothetical protein [Natronomonas gomsonensis]|uniref:hypothetical protein n=1 Tax=Natronomonas gomsonensis TaxID=1046043 RepID=UPI0015B82FCC|nr:hypothetical protein [Natronomonas gomsonensis]